ncbi:MAG: hypothetical protein IJH34_09570 [Romboutsia sp.]|nr:hypothetical protein [Romboutsia sp.]
MAKNHICSAVEFGKLSWPQIMDFESYLGQSEPEVNQQKQSEMEMNQMIEMFKNVK